MRSKPGYRVMGRFTGELLSAKSRRHTRSDDIDGTISRKWLRRRRRMTNIIAESINGRRLLAAAAAADDEELNDWSRGRDECSEDRRGIERRSRHEWRQCVVIRSTSNNQQTAQSNPDLTFKVLTQLPYLHNLITIQRPRSTRSSSVVTLARLPTPSSLRITDRSFSYASPCLWNQLPVALRQPLSLFIIPDSPIPLPSTSSSVDSPLSLSITPSLSFTPGLKPTCLTNTSHYIVTFFRDCLHAVLLRPFLLSNSILFLVLVDIGEYW